MAFSAGLLPTALAEGAPGVAGAPLTFSPTWGLGPPDPVSVLPFPKSRVSSGPEALKNQYEGRCQGSNEQKAWEVGGKSRLSHLADLYSNPTVPLQCGLKQETSPSLGFPSVKGDNSPNPQCYCEE